jgi:hypothetical protein
MVEATREMIKYIDTKSNDYKRTYANSTQSASNPQGDVVIDFYEEVLVPLMVVERPLDVQDDDQVILNRKPNYLEIEREKKVSITLTKSRAVELAHWILDNVLEEDEGNDDENS